MTAYLIVALCFCGVWFAFNALGVLAADAEEQVLCAINLVVLTLAIIGLSMGLAA